MPPLSQSISVCAGPRRPAASTPCARRRPPGARRSRSAPPDRRRARSPARPRRPCLRRRARRPSAAGPAPRTRARLTPVSAPTGFVAALKITLRHWAPRASAKAWSASRRGCTRRRAARTPRAGPACGSNGPMVVRPYVPVHVPARRCRPERRAADHALDVLGDPPRCRRRSGPSDAARRERPRGRGDRGARVHRLRRDDPEVAGRQFVRVGRRPRRADDLTAPRA